MPQTILITGCSSGIGAAMAEEFHKQGHRVFASARRPESLAPLADKGIKTLPLDVNDEASIAAAMASVESAAGQLDMLVNNAGFSQVGAVLDLQREDLRAQYETNVIAPIAVTRAALPLLRAAVSANGSARVVNVGSIVGREFRRLVYGADSPLGVSSLDARAAGRSTQQLSRCPCPFWIPKRTVERYGLTADRGQSCLER